MLPKCTITIHFRIFELSFISAFIPDDQQACITNNEKTHERNIYLGRKYQFLP